MLIGKLKDLFKKYLITGLIVLMPLWASYYVLKGILGIADGLIRLLPKQWQPEQLFGFSIPGLGIILTVVIVTVVGFLARLYFFKYFIRIGERTIKKIPLVRVIYSATQQLMEVILTKRDTQFKRVIMVEFPRQGIYSIGFVTGISSGEVQEKTAEEVVNVFLPTTPNPTSGFYIMVPRKDVINLDMSVEEAFKLIVSGGIVSPPSHVENVKGEHE